MIIAKIFSGLGNQMFQYAAGRAASLRLQTELSLDLSWFELPDEVVRLKRDYALDCFSHIAAPAADKADCRRIGYVDDFGWSGWGKLKRRINHGFKSLSPKASYVTDKNEYIDDLLPNHDYYLDGYWQSEHFFIDYITQIRQDFCFTDFHDEKNMSLSGKLLAKENTVGVHIRRGDYVNSPADAKVLGGICTIEYYKAALEIVNKQLIDPLFIIFSDDFEWVMHHFPLPKSFILVDWNTGSNSINDMSLMSKCKHNIIANSSFSWWGAWLNANPEKIIICPRCWTNTHDNNKHPAPHRWIKL